MRQRSGRTWRPSRGSLSAERVVPDPVALWTSSVFVEEARAWVAAQLAPRGSRLTGEWEQPHARVWSSTIRFETLRSRLVRSSGPYERAISWESALQDAPVTVVAAEEFPVRGWLLELLEPWADVG